MWPRISGELSTVVKVSGPDAKETEPQIPERLTVYGGHLDFSRVRRIALPWEF